jgi:hypothetical protein
MGLILAGVAVTVVPVGGGRAQVMTR